MQNKYCLPIISSNFEGITEKIESKKHDYQYFEIWLDYIENLEINKIAELVQKLPDRIVLVFRRQNLEPIKLTFTERTKILEEFAGLPCLVDLDVSCQQEDLEYVKENSLKIKAIVSLHNYQQTPSDEQLIQQVEIMQNYNPYIIKLSTFCSTQQDALRLMTLQQSFIEQNRKHIVLGMGKNGLITRVFATLWGNELVFVPETVENKTAEGQIAKNKLDSIMQALEGLY